jgi:hypothetical protein
MTQAQVREQNIISAAVDSKTRAALKRRAAAADRTVSAEVRRAVRMYLDDGDQELDDEGDDPDE